MKPLTVCLWLLLPVIAGAQGNFYFFGSKKDKSIAAITPSRNTPAAGTGPATSRNYTIDIVFEAAGPGRILPIYSKGYFITQKGRLSFRALPGPATEDESQSLHHFIVSRNEDRIGLYVDDYCIATYKGMEDIFDLDFPWFDVQLFSGNEEKIAFPGIKTVTISAQPRKIPEKAIPSKNDNLPNEAYCRIYPNPVADRLYVYLNKSKAWIKVTDLGGRQIYFQQSAAQGLLMIPAANLPPGVYLVTITADQFHTVQKIVKR